MNSSAPATDRRCRQSFLTELQDGRLRWDLISPFPRQDDDDRREGDAAVETMTRFVREHVDPDTVDRTGRLPEDFHEQCAERGYFALAHPVEQGGLGFSPLNAFRVVQAAASWSVTAAFAIAVNHGFGAGAYLPVLGEGELRATILRVLAEGQVSGDADTEPRGALNRGRATTATPAEDGSGYLISGEKVFIQNGPTAHLLRVSATVRENSREYIGLFFVDTGSPGFTVTSWHEYLGFKGIPNAALRLDRVFVPRSRMFTSPESWHSDEEWRLSPELNAISVRARMYPISGSALAIGKMCLHWSRDFVRRRTVEGRGLEQYDEIQRIVTSSLADVFAIQSVTEWCLLADRPPHNLDTTPEQAAAKNINSLTCWRIIDRTMSLLAAEGLETAPSKAHRGAPPLPVERFFRDARGLRISGGVDFMVDHFAARSALARHVAHAASSPQQADDDQPEQPETGEITPFPAEPADRELTEPNRAHLRFVAEQARGFAATCRALIRRHTDPEQLYAQERTLILLGRISGELFTMSAVLARAARLSAQGHPMAQELADVYCTEARHRVTDAVTRLSSDDEPDHARVCAAWLHQDHFEFLGDDTITGLSSSLS